MKKNNLHKVAFSRITIGKAFLIILIFYVIIVGGRKTIENYQLRANGICAKAVIIYKKNVGSRGIIDTHYEFRVNGNIYQGFSSHDDSALTGDTIIVVYLKSDPSVNRSNTLLGIKCTN